MSVLLPALAPMGIILAGLVAYPFAESWVTGDRREHHIAERPRENPHRTAIGMAAVTFYGVLWLMASNDVIAAFFSLSLNAMIVLGRFLVFLAPALAYYVTYRICLGLQRRDAADLGHGVETGVIERRSSGEYIEVHVPPNEAIEARIRGKEPVPMIAGPPGGHGDGEADPVPSGEGHGRIARLRALLSRTYGGEKVPLDGEHGVHEGNGAKETGVRADAGGGGRAAMGSGTGSGSGSGTGSGSGPGTRSGDGEGRPPPG